MTIYLETKQGTLILQPEQLIAPTRQMVWIGAPSEEVYNTICAEGLDEYQCTIRHDSETGDWILSEGQVRTHCPRGLKSDRSKACSVCRGCCVCLHTANPDYSLRIPSCKTLLNGQAITSEGTSLKEGDRISIAHPGN